MSNTMNEFAPHPRSSEQARIEYMTAIRTIDFPSEWYEANSENHFWFQWRARAADSLTRRVGLPANQPLHVLDIGCGTGITARQLRRTTRWVFDGADLNVEALSRCAGDMRRVLYYDILEKNEQFRDHYDVIVLFDVVEHIEDTRPFLDAVLFHLKPGGVILVNVPALMSLFSEYDTVAGHYRRYSLETMAAEFTSFDATVVDQIYWGFTMVPLLWLRQKMLRGQTNEAEAIRTGFVPPSPLAHAILKGVMKAETSILARPPLGSSVMSVIRKNGGAANRQ
jgi:2-polyprenyl-3-methyl-5-hydroxy-6-metoxy-1,4-benzoquinol methylase